MSSKKGRNKGSLRKYLIGFYLIF